MKAKTLSLFLALLLLTTTIGYAQNSLSVSGLVKNGNGQPLSGITITLINQVDSSVNQTTTTDKNGNYLINSIKKGSYKLNISMVGYKPGVLSFNVDSVAVVLPLAVIEASNVSLAEVRIISKKPLVEQKIDRMVINVDAMLSTSGSTALEVLEKSPGVIMGQNGAVSLNGKGVSIFIDGKPTYLSGADLENYLRSLPSAVLDQIELMTNPPSKYDAAGNGGVINIRTKRTKIKGINGGANLSYIQGNYARINSGIDLNYRNNKVNVSGNISYITNNSYSNLDINRSFDDAAGINASKFLQSSFARNKSKIANSRIGLDYYVSDKTTLGVGLTGVYRLNNQNAVVRSQLLNSNDQLDSTIRADNNEKGSFKNGGINFNIRHEFDNAGREFTADVDYLNYSTSRNQEFVNDSYLANGTLAKNELLTGYLPTKINIYSAKADYSHPLKNGIKLSAGLKTNITLTDNEAVYFNTKGGMSLPDYDKTNNFTYKESINAAYINASKEFKKFTVQMGLRLENTFSKGHQLGNVTKPDSTFNRNYTSLFPTLYLQYKLDTIGNNVIGFNYGRRINRPYYQDLNPFISPIDKFTYYTGNPFLKPSYSNSIELSHTYKNRLTTTLSYSRTLDQVNETIEILNGIYYSRPGNIGQSTFKSFAVNASVDPLSWLTVNLYAQVSNIHSIGSFYTGYLDTQGTFLYLKPLFQFKLKKDWIFQFDGYYQSKVTNAQFVAGEQKRINAALSKKLSASTTIKLVVNDIFHSYVNSGVINNLSQTRADYRNVIDTRTAIFTLSYRFGKAISGQRKHDTNSADNEKGRVKN